MWFDSRKVLSGRQLRTYWFFGRVLDSRAWEGVTPERVNVWLGQVSGSLVYPPGLVTTKFI